MKWIRNGSLVIAVLYLFLFIYPSFASAHAYIIKSTPYENEIVNQAPQKVMIQFDETIQPSFHSIEVFDSEGKRMDQKNGGIDPKNPSIIESSLDENLPDGTYSVQWRVVSSDGHPVEGVIPFQIGNGDTSQDHSDNRNESKGYLPKWDLIMIRWFQYVSNACFVGILFFYLFVLNKELVQDRKVNHTFSKIIKLSFITLVLSISLSLPLQATIESGLSWNKALSIPVLSEMLSYTQFGKTWMIQIGCLFFLLIFTYFLLKKKFKPFLIWICFILGIGLLLSKSFTSHAASTTNVYLTISLDFLHLLSASIWIGSLMTLIALIPLSRNVDTKKQYVDSIRRFSKWGIVLVIVLTITGIISSLSYIPNVKTLLTTNYGRVLSGKVLLLVIMILFAAVNFVKGKQSREKGLPSTLWGELITGLIVLVLSVLLTNLPSAMLSPGPYKEAKTGNHGSYITLEVTPNIIGKNTFVLFLKDQQGRPMKNIEQVTLTFTSLDMDMGEDIKTLIKVQAGKYKAQGMNFNMAGRWNVHAHALTKDLETVDTDFKVLVGSQ
ncbi:copper resistance protein CopC [Neobacillus drentensis]|uniref:copper resistance CopC/CopD family protein n=1 Tax=Neobacillus drentensis TaxID=220684 RepID=UPI001F298C2C|nr:copper resistance protein CopC [Neobacillus drentensis]ULT56828.1 copper resistance protein CopC [Neobacillus drentensis]